MRVSVAILGLTAVAHAVSDVIQPHKLSRIAFGSCSKVQHAQPLWKEVKKFTPDLWLWGGDAVYYNKSGLTNRDNNKAVREMLESQRVRTDYHQAVKSAVVEVIRQHSLNITS